MSDERDLLKEDEPNEPGLIKDEEPGDFQAHVLKDESGMAEESGDDFEGHILKED